MLINNMNKLMKWLVIMAFVAGLTSVLASAFDDFFIAAKNDNESAIVGLTLRGFDLNTVNDKGESALLIAIREGSDKVIHFLLKQPSVKVEQRNAAGESPLMLVALKGNAELAEKLIARKAEVNKTGWTPLHYACSNPNPDSAVMVRLLLEHHAYIDAESPNKTTPLMMAAQYGHPDLVSLLLEEGADPHLRNQKGLTAIDFARRAGRDEQASAIAAAIRAKRSTGRW